MGVDGAWTPELADTVVQNDPEEEVRMVQQMLQFKPNMLWLLEQTRGCVNRMNRMNPLACRYTFSCSTCH